jgi:hypothetical protein
MNKIIAYIFGEFATVYLKKLIYIALITSAIIAILAMWGSFVVAFFFVIDNTQNLINIITSGSVGGGAPSDILCKLIGILNILGFYEAIDNTKGIWLSGLTFIAGRLLFNQTIKAYLSLLSLLQPLLTR